MNKTCALGIVLAILVCCGGAALGRSSGGFEYFPLSAGRWWMYKTPFKRTVADCLKVKGSERFYIQEYNDDIQVGGGQYRVEGNWLLKYSDDSRGHADWTPPARWLHVPLRVGDSWEFRLGMEKCVTVVERHERIVVPAGRFTCLRVKRTWTRDHDKTSNVVLEWYARDVGLVKNTWGGETRRELMRWGLHNPPRAGLPIDLGLTGAPENQP